jgi:L-rhamnose mutarotase
MSQPALQRICFTLNVRSDRLADYRAAHADVWQEMKDALTRHGWHNYTLFLREDGLLIGYVETPDFAAAVAGMQDEEVNARWQSAMIAFFEPLVEGAADKSMTPLAEVFHLD